MQHLVKRRVDSVVGRAAAGGEGYPSRCLMFGCTRPTMRATGKGLAPFYCKRHIEHRARHGSLFHGTYSAAELKPYRQAAALWIKTHSDEGRVAETLRALGLLLQFSGRLVPASSLRGMKPRERANVALARLREAGIDPAKLLEIHLGVAALIEEDPGSHRVREFRIVQTAKAVHRLASGYHRKWDWTTADGRAVPFELHAYARSTGRVLRHLGEMIEVACEVVAAHHLVDVLALKVARYGQHPALPPELSS